MQFHDRRTGEVHEIGIHAKNLSNDVPATSKLTKGQKDSLKRATSIAKGTTKNGKRAEKNNKAEAQTREVMNMSAKEADKNWEKHGIEVGNLSGDAMARAKKGQDIQVDRGQ